MKRETEEENIDWESIKAAVVAGESFRAVAQRYGLKVSRISMRSTRGKWKRELNEEDKQMALRREEVAREIELELDEIGGRLRRSGLRSKTAIAEQIEKLLKELKEAGSELGLMTRSRCLANVASVCEKLHRWREEPVAEDPRTVPMVNLRLIRTSPQELRALARLKGIKPAKAVEVEGVEEAG
jgi:phosphoglycolate phosphatase-like HAD superfamily hydrolase